MIEFPMNTLIANVFVPNNHLIPLNVVFSAEFCFKVLMVKPRGVSSSAFKEASHHFRNFGNPKGWAGTINIF